MGISKTKTYADTIISCEECNSTLLKCDECNDYFDIQEIGEEIICVDGENHYHADCYKDSIQSSTDTGGKT